MSESKSICVFCSSSHMLAPHFYEAAEALGQRMGERGDTLVYGAGAVGLMGSVAKAAKAAGSKIVGVCPANLHEMGLCWEEIDDLRITQDLRDRKAIMEELADAYVILPGGFGTLDEMMEALAMKQLDFHQKPIVLLNTDGFFDPLIELFNHVIDLKFAKDNSHQMYFATDQIDVLFEHIDEITEANHDLEANKWLHMPED